MPVVHVLALQYENHQLDAVGASWSRSGPRRANVNMVVLISSARLVCTVVVTVDADPEVIDDMLEHARLGITTDFRECEGFIAGALHVSTDRTRLVQYLQWDSEAAYLRCRDDPKWDELDSTKRFLNHISTGRALVDARLFEVLADSGQPTHEDDQCS